jgi:hypothetical protein
MFNRLFFSVFVFAVSSTLSMAQSPDSGSASSSSAKPAVQPASGQANTSAGKTDASAEKKKPKKVWTDEEIGSIKGGVSVVGEAKTGSDGTGARGQARSTTANQSRRMLIENYREQIRQFESQIAAADTRIAQLKNFKGENTGPTSGIDMHQGYNMVPLEDQVKQLEDRKKQLKAKIEDVENDARKNGIQSGDLR